MALRHHKADRKRAEGPLGVVFLTDPFLAIWAKLSVEWRAASVSTKPSQLHPFGGKDTPHFSAAAHRVRASDGIPRA